MPTVMIDWDKDFFELNKRPLFTVLELYSYANLPDNKGSWSTHFIFEQSPSEQGFITVGQVNFLVDEAPHEILQNGFTFGIFDGAKQLGTCEIIE